MSRAFFELDYESQELHLARTPFGLEAYIPAGRPARKDAEIIANGRFACHIDLQVGVTQLPRHLFKGSGKTSLPDDEKILFATISFPGDNTSLPFQFTWSDPPS